MLSRSLPWFLLLALLAEVLGTVGGFGSSVYFVPMANFFMDFQSVLGITALYHLSSNLSKIGFFRKGIDRTLLLYLGIPAVVLVAAGAWLSKWVDPESLSLVLGVFLLVFALVFLLKRELRVHPSRRNAVTGGALSGFLAGILGTGGAVRGAVMTAFNLPKERFIATSAVIDLGIDLSRTLVYAGNGYIHKHDLYLVPFLIVISIVGTFAGKKILERISQEQFRGFVLVLLMGIGVITLLAHLPAVLRQ
ncbi:sulfite exporter TauE/SafE family protein [Robiginitalea sp. M366]|uniref:sulfite exporter TauE/SafE family protein n=1 Tax=Robiginitalea aestuariiviva TaxID=3036903 RepID=UPI00240D13C8|nr:sulfite exporter TauE/SafE family protein [Robiginitalea aestuariiviva]MDG1572439.1 sulfite exporter TauE/SafE family protein [Robiginitalea aestuariiviva]